MTGRRDFIGDSSTLRTPLARALPILAIAATTVLVLHAPSTAYSATEAAHPIFAAIQSAIAERRVDKTAPLGFGIPQKPFVELPTEGALLVGFEFGIGDFMDIETVYALRPIFLTAAGEETANAHGLFGDQHLARGKVRKSKVKRTERITASPGYAVGGATLRTGLNINGMSLTFMRINGLTLDPDQHYESAWIGDRTGGHESFMSGKGAAVIGVYGSEDNDHVSALGLLFVKESTAAAAEAPPPATTVAPPEKRADAPSAPAVAPPSAPSKPIDKPAPPDVSGMSWIVPVITFAAVAVPIFFVLLMSLSRKESVEKETEDDELDRAERQAALRRSARPTVPRAVPGEVLDAVLVEDEILDAVPVRPARRVKTDAEKEEQLRTWLELSQDAREPARNPDAKPATQSLAPRFGMIGCALCGGLFITVIGPVLCPPPVEGGFNYTRTLFAGLAGGIGYRVGALIGTLVEAARK